MKQKMGALLTLCFFFILVLCAYVFSGNKTISFATEWARGKIEIKDGMYDVIVVGSDPEGIAAAIGAARSGAKVLLLGKEEGPGGLLTYGMLNTLDMNRNSEGLLLTRGVFSEFYSAIGNTESFDVEKAKTVFCELIEDERNLEYKSGYKFSKAILDEKTITGVTMVSSTGKEESFFGKRIIDATQDGDVCVSAGVPYFIGMEDVNWSQKMATTLVFKVGGVKWKDIETDINRYKTLTADTDCGFNRSTAWGFGKWCYDKYTPLHANMQLRGPNMGRQNDGTILINALQIFDVDGLSEESKKLAMEQGKEEAEHIIEYLKTKLNSFKNAYLAGVADELYIRETRHIKGEYSLKATDVLGNVNFIDKIAWASYPIDIQATSKDNTGYVIGSPNQYSIPYRCTVPLEIDNLFIVSKAASYSSVAAGSARVVPTGMAVGEATGIAAVYTITKDVTPRELTLDSGRGKMKQLQGILKNQGIYLPEVKGRDVNAHVEGYGKIKKIINLGLLSGGYNNNFSFDSAGYKNTFSYLLVNLLQRGGAENYTFALGQKLLGYAENERITGGGAARICAMLLGEYDEAAYVPRQAGWTDEEYKMKKEERIAQIEDETWEIAKNNNYFAENFKKEDVLTKRQIYVIAVDIIERFMGRELGV